MKVTDLIPWRSGSMPARRKSADPVGLLQTDINRLFDDFLQTMPLAWSGTSLPEPAISGEKHDDREVEGKGFLLRERRYGRIERSIPLPEGLDADEARASFKNGVLTIEIPKGEDAKRISIRKS